MSLHGEYIGLFWNLAIFNDFYENVWGCKYTFHIENACGLTLDSFFYNISKQNNNIDWKMSKTRKQFKKIQNSDWINSTNHEMKQVQHLKTIISKIWLTKFHTAWMIVYSQWDGASVAYQPPCDSNHLIHVWYLQWLCYRQTRHLSIDNKWSALGVLGAAQPSLHHQRWNQLRLAGEIYCILPSHSMQINDNRVIKLVFEKCGKCKLCLEVNVVQLSNVPSTVNVSMRDINARDNYVDMK